LLAQAASGLDTSRAGHAQVEQDHIRVELAGLFEGGGGIVGFAGHIDIAGDTQQLPQSFNHDFMVIYEKDGDHGDVSCRAGSVSRAASVDALSAVSSSSCEAPVLIDIILSSTSSDITSPEFGRSTITAV